MKAAILLRALVRVNAQGNCQIADFTHEDLTDRKDHLIALFGTDKAVVGKPYRHTYLCTLKPLFADQKEISADVIIKDPDGKYVYMYKIED